ncbi:hypothetical protein DP939_04785 [Spongiactinospora rosea]|uniref:Uncharacterized protein n=1 Tax=Spongiactinospora rosea TaxID=2248750 RepID=A0A366M711_9ACTN|nr:hypothetical protein [Spongiactinospora rosea]RBQ21986.1 hypothetical protein DP939_04785 [Spongiactinospora rosea]
MSSTPSLERHYRRLLHAYPKVYREQHGDELVGTLLEAAGPHRHRPTLREAASLLTGGFTARARAARRPAGPPWWADGIHLGILAVAAATVAMNVRILPYPIPAIWAALMIVLLFAIILGWTRLALPLALVAAIQVSRPLMYEAVEIPIPYYGPGFGDISAIAPYWLIVAGSAILAFRSASAPSKTRISRWMQTMPARSGLWLLVPLAYWALQSTGFAPESRAALEILAFLVALLATIAARDSRWALAAAIYLLPGLIYLAENVTNLGTRGMVYWSVLTILLIAALTAAYRTRKRHSSPT